MRPGFPLLSISLLTAAFCSAGTLTDVFNQVQSNCNYNPVPPYGNCDVMGSPQLYDIQSAGFSINGSAASLVIYLNSGAVQNSGGVLTLNPFEDSGATLVVGDVFFYNINSVYDPSDPSTTQFLRYGLAITSHDGFQAGDLYAITGSIGTATAQQALNNYSNFYRLNEAVLMTGSHPPVGSGTVSVADNGDGITSGRYTLSSTFSLPPAFLDLLQDAQIGLLFSSADCGNDVIQGAVATPEPSSGMLLLGGLALLAAVRRWTLRAA